METCPQFCIVSFFPSHFVYPYTSLWRDSLLNNNTRGYTERPIVGLYDMLVGNVHLILKNAWKFKINGKWTQKTEKVENISLVEPC